MNSIAQGNVGNMIITNSNMGNMGGAMTSGGMVANTLKQQINTGSLLGPGIPAGQSNQGMHHGGHQAGLQNGPIMGTVGVAVPRMVGQQHMVRAPNPHLMGSGPRMQNPNLPLGKYN